jgi:hypothetical protein
MENIKGKRVISKVFIIVLFTQEKIQTNHLHNDFWLSVSQNRVESLHIWEHREADGNKDLGPQFKPHRLESQKGAWNSHFISSQMIDHHSQVSEPLDSQQTTDHESIWRTKEWFKWQILAVHRNEKRVMRVQRGPQTLAAVTVLLWDGHRAVDTAE